MNDRRIPSCHWLATTVLATVLAAQGVPDPDFDLAHHFGRRLTYGTSLTFLDEVAQQAPATMQGKLQAWVQRQLSPSAAGDPFWPYGSQAVRDLVQPGGALGLAATLGSATPKASIDSAQLAYALASSWQAREKLGRFWDDHFNTNLISGKGYFTGAPVPPVTVDDFAWWLEWQANDWYRQNAFTTFDQLLLFTSQHASMMIYLSMPWNTKTGPNEDYARELLELYTMSPETPVPGGSPIKNYDQSDVEKVARVLTGWSVDPANQYAFVFNSGDHDYPSTPHTLFTVSGSPVTLPLPVAPNGVVEGLRLLRNLAGRTATADFICRKLIGVFVGEGVADSPGSTLLANMKAAWGQLGDIKAVLTVMFASSEFQAPANFLVKARTPIEAVVAAPRALGATIPYDSATSLPVPTCLWTLDGALLAMGQPLLNFGAPNGFASDLVAQLSPSLAVERAKLAATSLFSTAPTLNLGYDLVTLVQSQVHPSQHQNFVAINRAVLRLLYGTNYTANDEVQLASVTAGVVAWFNLFAPPPGFDVDNPVHYQGVVYAVATAAAGMTQSGLR